MCTMLVFYIIILLEFYIVITVTVYIALSFIFYFWICITTYSGTFLYLKSLGEYVCCIS